MSVLRLNAHHKRAVLLLIGVITLDVLTGVMISVAEHVPLWHGVYCATGLTTTDGCDLQFTSTASYVFAWLAMILFVPLWTAVFSFFTSGLTAEHVVRVTDEQTEALKEHISR